MNQLIFGEYINPERVFMDQPLPTLKLGDENEYVKLLQYLLRFTIGYNGPIHGIFDENTENYVKEFQKKHFLSPNGIVNGQFWDNITNYINDYNQYIYNIANSDLKLYKVKRGDDLYEIAKNNNTTVDEITRINLLTSSNIEPGLELILPNTETTNSQPSEVETVENENMYSVKPGDTLYSIAKAFNTSVDEIKKNNALDSDLIVPGQNLYIEANTIGEPITELPEYYTVIAGDTLYSIARRYNLTVDELKRQNNLVTNLITIGMNLKIR